MHWELWDRGSANLIEEFRSEVEALQGVRDMLAANSPELVDELSIGAVHDEGEPHGAELPPSLYGEALRARLAAMGQKQEQETDAEAAQNVHARIRRWLAEEGWHVRDVPDPQARFNIMATLQGGQNVNIFQYEQHIDHLTVSQHWQYDSQLAEDIGQLPRRIQRDMVWDIYRDVSFMGVDFSGHDVPPQEMIFRSYIYFDALTKDSLIQRVLLTIRALHLAVRTVMRSLEENDKSVEAASRQLHLVPRTGGARTAAS